MYINTNVSSLIASNNVKRSTDRSRKLLEKLSSGSRINQAADDAAGLTISEKLKSQINGTAQAQRNSQDAISLIQTADGGLGEIEDDLQRMRELSVEAANGTLGNEDRSALQKEFNQLRRHIDEIANNTQFNDINLLNVTPPAPPSSGGTSVLGLDFTSSTSGTGSSLKDVTWSGSLYVAAYNGGVLTSPDGKTWSSVSLPGSVNSVKYVGGKYIAVGDSGDIFTSTDGATWTQRNHDYTDPTNLSDVMWDGTNYIAVGTYVEGGANASNFYISPDGNSWSPIFFDVITLGATSAAYNGSRHLMTCNDGELVYSDGDLSHWDWATSDTSGDIYSVSHQSLNDVIWGGGQFVTVGDSGKIFTSADGINFTEHSSGTSANLRSITWTGSQYLAVGDNGALVTSNDGVTWSADHLGSTSFAGVVSNGTGYTVVGSGGSVYNAAAGGGGSGGSGGSSSGSGSISLQIGANAGDSFQMDLVDARSSALGLMMCDIGTQSGAQQAMQNIDQSIDTVNSYRSTFGATQNALDHTINNLSNSEQNLTAAKSVISDADMAQTMVEYTKEQITLQSAESMAAQANQLSENVLKLLS